MNKSSIDSLMIRKELAQKATPGPWKLTGIPDVVDILQAETRKVVGAGYKMADAAHIAANDPSTVMAIIDEILRLRAEVQRLEKEADWLARAAANGGWHGVRVSPKQMRDEARKALGERD